MVDICHSVEIRSHQKGDSSSDEEDPMEAYDEVMSKCFNQYAAGDLRRFEPAKDIVSELIADINIINSQPLRYFTELRSLLQSVYNSINNVSGKDLSKKLEKAYELKKPKSLSGTQLAFILDARERIVGA